MKNKFVIFFLLILFFTPGFAHAEKVLHINVHTDQGDGTLQFWLASYLMGNWFSGGPFYVTTINQVGTALDKNVSEAPPGYNPAYYYVEEQPTQDYQLSRIDCYCENKYRAPGIFSYSGNKVYIYPTGDSNTNCSLNFYCDFYNKKIRTPILIVPGVMGTEMKKGDELLWPNITGMLTSLSDSFMDPLALSTNLTPLDNSIYTNSIIKKVPFFDYTNELINEFAGQGYIEGQTLFTFPYDWRYGISGKNLDGKTNPDLLKEKIQQILTQTGASEVDVVAHSMGGLIVKKYAMDNSVTNKIGKAVFVGVPNTGAPKALKMLLQGDNMDVLGLNDQELKKISQNMPSVYDLLPSQQYYNAKGSYIQTIDQTKCFEDYTIPCEVKNLNYQESKSFLINAGTNSTALNNADILHAQAYDDFDLRTAGVDLYAIDGCKTATFSKIIQTKYNDVFGQQFSYDRRVSPGDGTVPLESATNLPIDSVKKYYALVSSHGKMPSQNGIRQKIVNIISNSNLEVDSAQTPIITQDISRCQLNGRAISVFSPVDIFAVDQKGNKLGLADDGSIINEIPGADFEILGDEKFMYLPHDEGQTYNVSMEGTGSGTYTIKSQSITNNQIGKTEIFSNLPVATDTTGQINLLGLETTLSVRQNIGDDLQTILPTQVIDYSSDTTSPEAVIYFDSTTKDLKIYGTDNLSSISGIPVVDNGNSNSVVLTDEAGNTVEIAFDQKNRRAAMSADITLIKYNGVLVNMGSNLFSYSWSFDKSGKLAKLTQKVKSRNNYSITAVYDGTNTKITGTDSSGKIAQSFLGLKIIKVSTNKGEFNWSY
jgi:triacylglycerol esterase/lipase EstA (alpha/beta hydrolase family)